MTDYKNAHEVRPELPYTNRGVKPTSNRSGMVSPTDRELLTVMIDWCQITVKAMSPRDIAEKVLRIPYWLFSNEFRGGIKGGYKGLMSFDDIRVYEPSGKNKDNGYQIVMAGKGCRNFEKFLEANEESWYDFFERALGFGVNFPRIDLAIDDRKTYFKIAKLAKLAREGMAVTRLKIGDSHTGFHVGGGQAKRGDTLYIGSRYSEFYMCFYEKGYEQAEKYGGDPVDDWNRYELRFRQKRAVNLARELVARRDVATVALEVLNESIRFVKRPEGSKDTNRWRYPLWEPWAWFMRDVGKCKLTMKPEVKDYYDRLAWLEKAVFPTLKAYMKIDEIMGAHTIEEALKETKLDKKHLWIIDSCVRQLQAENEKFNKERPLIESRVELRKMGFMDWEGKETPFDGDGKDYLRQF